MAFDYDAVDNDRDGCHREIGFARFINDGSLRNTNDNVRMIVHHDPYLEFVYRLSSGLHSMGSNDPLVCEERWKREFKRQIDITQLSQQTETYDIEIDWHALVDIARNCGFDIKDGDIVPLPLFMFRRFVQTEFECVSDPNVFFSHRTFNQHLAALLSTYGMVPYLRTMSENDARVYYEDSWLPVFKYGGNYRLEEANRQVNEQRALYNSTLRSLNGRVFMSVDKQFDYARYMHYTYSLFQNYPVLAYVKARTEGCTIFRFQVRRYQTRVSGGAHAAGAKIYRPNLLKRMFFGFCGATLIEYSYQWLRDSAFLKIVFPQDCRSALARTIGQGLSASDAEFSDGVLFSSVHRDHTEEPWDGSGGETYLRCHVIPKFRATVRFLVPTLLEIMFLILIAILWGFVPWGNGPAPVSQSLLLTMGLAQLGAAFLSGDINESPFLTNALKTPRVTMVLSSVFHCALLTVTLLCATTNGQGLGGLTPTATGPIVWWFTATMYCISIIGVLTMIAWAMAYMGWRFLDRFH